MTVVGSQVKKSCNHVVSDQSLAVVANEHAKSTAFVDPFLGYLQKISEFTPRQTSICRCVSPARSLSHGVFSAQVAFFTPHSAFSTSDILIEAVGGFEMLDFPSVF